MGGKKSLDVGTPPAPYQEPFTQKGLEAAFEQATLASTQEGLPPTLQAALEFDPDILTKQLESQLAISQPLIRRTGQDIINQSVNIGGATTSQLTNALSQYASDLGTQLGGYALQGALSERERAFGTSERLFGLGLGGFTNIAQLGIQRESVQNQAQQQAYENQLAMAMANQDSRGGILGGLTGGVGGALLGVAAAPFTGGSSLLLGGLGALGGGAAGALGPQGTGGHILSAGALLAGLGGLSSLTTKGAGALSSSGVPSGLTGALGPQNANLYQKTLALGAI